MILVIQVNGKILARQEFDENVDKEAAIKKCRDILSEVYSIDTTKIRKEVYVPTRLINFIT
jgi:hypothetical protein